MEAELQTYLDKHGVEQMLKDLVIKLCVAKPDNVLQFMKEYIVAKQQEGEEVEDDTGERWVGFLFHCKMISLFS